MFDFGNKQPCAIALTDFGITTAIITTIEDIEEVTQQFETYPDSAWCEGRGKKYLFKMLKKKLKIQDTYFNKNIEEITALNQTWVDFCDDCLLLFVLDTHLNGKPFRLMHPELFKKLKKDAPFDATSGVDPVLIPGIPIEQ